jgi:hypothetical protein
LRRNARSNAHSGSVVHLPPTNVASVTTPVPDDAISSMPVHGTNAPPHQTSGRTQPPMIDLRLAKADYEIRRRVAMYELESMVAPARRARSFYRSF